MRFFDPAKVRSTGLVQDFTVETDNPAYFERLLRAAVEVCGFRQLAYTESDGRVGSAAPTDHPSEVYARMGDRRGPPGRPVYWHVCRLFDGPVNPGYGSREPMSGETAVPCADAAAAVAGVMELLRRVDLDAFTAACGPDGPFDCDSSTRVGFRLHLSYLSRGLTVALCHVYYPK